MTENETDNIEEVILNVLQVRQFVRRKDLLKGLLEGMEIPDVEGNGLGELDPNAV